MGVEFHITRAEHWFENDAQQISSEEWLALVDADPELMIDASNGEFHAVWLGKSSYEEPWLEWSAGNISTKWPDTALYRKMLEVAQTLNAKVVDDDERIYDTPDAWQFEPRNRPAASSTDRARAGTSTAERSIIQRILSLFVKRKK